MAYNMLYQYKVTASDATTATLTGSGLPGGVSQPPSQIVLTFASAAVKPADFPVGRDVVIKILV